MAFSDIPIRENGKGFLVVASWWNTIRTELILAFGTGGYIKEATAQTVAGTAEVILDPLAYKPLAPVSGDGGAQTSSTTPFGVAHGFSGGKEIILLGTSDANPLTIPSSDIDEGVYSNGDLILTKGVQKLLIYNEAMKRFFVQE